MCVVVVDPLVPSLGRPHAGVGLRGALRQRWVHGGVFGNRCRLGMFWVLTLGENKGVVL